jgi:hypothetical protein
MSDQKSLLLGACLMASACLILGANGANARGGSHGGGSGSGPSQHEEHHQNPNPPPAAAGKPVVPAATVRVHSGAIVTNGGAGAAASAPAAPTVVIRDHRGAPAGTAGRGAAPAPSPASTVIVRDHRSATVASNGGVIQPPAPPPSNPGIGQTVKSGAGDFVSQLRSGFVLGGKAIGHEAKSVASTAASAAKSVYHFVGGLF